MYLLLLGCFCAIFVLITCKDNNVYWKQKIHVPYANHVSVYLNNKVKEDIFVIVNYLGISIRAIEREIQNLCSMIKPVMDNYCQKFKLHLFFN